jgi:uncharacterized membrane protein (DUF2068 family)
MKAGMNRGRVAERGVALLECAKGVAVLLIGFGIAAALHHYHDVEDIASTLLFALHIEKHHHLSAIFLRAADRLENTNLIMIAVAAASYSLLRFIEAYGLWNGRAWAEWFALISGAVYLPLEMYELSRHATPIRFGILVVNVIIVAYMLWLRWEAHVTSNSRRVET